MEDVIHPSRGVKHALIITNITNIELQFGAGVTLTHVILFLFITAENSYFGHITLQKSLKNSTPE